MTSATSADARVREWAAPLLVCILALLAALALGWYVTRAGEPLWLWAFARIFHGVAVPVAWALTQCCYWYVLGPLGLVLIGVAIVSPRWRAPAIFSLVMLLLSWRGADALQHLFARPRRLDWLVKHETSFSYPSSHAAVSFGFYLLWGALLWRSRLPSQLRFVAAVLLALLTIGICWSRLSLGAHYVTDLAGGALVALAACALGLAVCRAAGWRLSAAHPGPRR